MSAARRLLQRLTAVAAGGLLVIALVVPGAETALARGRGKGGGACRRQPAQRFLTRSSFVKRGLLQPAEHRRAVRYRVEKYGRIPGLGLDRLNPKTASSQAAQVTFMGLPLRVHRKVVAPLACVEHDLEQRCKSPRDRYEPAAVGGFREANTYRGGEVSNHLFGIAIDIDPERNPCCGCVDPWPDHPRCKAKKGKSAFEKTALTRCWIDSFERHGFYWLGRDSLQDTMHFEYLGDPDRTR